MATIQITPELLMAKAKEVRSLRLTHDYMISNLNTLVLGLDEDWRGLAQEEYVSSFKKARSQFNQFSEMLEEYAKLMDTAAREMQRTDESLAQETDAFLKTLAMGAVTGAATAAKVFPSTIEEMKADTEATLEVDPILTYKLLNWRDNASLMTLSDIEQLAALKGKFEVASDLSYIKVRKADAWQLYVKGTSEYDEAMRVYNSIDEESTMLNMKVYTGTNHQPGNDYSNFRTVSSFDENYQLKQSDTYPKYISSNGKNVACAPTAAYILNSMAGGQMKHNIDLTLDNFALDAHTKQISDSSGLDNKERMSLLGQQLLQGNPVLVRSNGRSNEQYHFVVAVGIKDTANLSDIKASDILIIDPYDGLVRTLDKSQGSTTRFPENNGSLRIVR